MDGAMKFVKGDAIAGLVIIFVNLIGGVAIGVFQKAMTTGEALQTYAILTIGDGLISQIPALFISITAGIIVTRVTTEDSKDLGRDLSRQVMNKPHALITGSGLLLLFAFMPNFPSLTFISLAILSAGVGFYVLKRRKKEEQAGGAPGGMPGAPGVAHTPGQAGGESPFSLPLLIEIDESLKAAINTRSLNEELGKVRSMLLHELGVPFPGVKTRFVNELGHGNYAILLNETPISKGQLNPGHVLVRDTSQNLNILDIPHESAQPFLSDAPTLWVSEEWIDTLEKAAMSHLDLPQIVAFHLSNVLRKNAEEFVGIQETRQLLEKMEQPYGELVKEVQRIMPIQKIAEILQRLVSENISIRNLRNILESLVEWGHKEKDVVQLAEYIRSGQKRYISHKFSNGHNLLPAYLLEEEAEEAIRNGIRMTSAGAYLALDPNISQQFLANVKKAVGDINELRQKPVLITSMDIRRYVRKLIELDLYELPVLSFQELTQDITVQPLNRIGINQ